MILLNTDEIIDIHKKLISRTGGSYGLRDENLLESAVYSAINSFGGEDVYPTVEEKAARLAFSLISNHCFIDGNKRIGILAMLLTLNINNINISFSQQKLITLGLSVAKGESKYEDILSWINKHKN